MRAHRSLFQLALVTTSTLGALVGCGGSGSDTSGPPAPDTLDLAAAYSLTLIDGEPLPWHEPPPDERTHVTIGAITVTPDTVKVRWTGYLEVPGCPECEPLPRLDSVLGRYARNGPASWVVMIAGGIRPMGISLDDEARLHLREKVMFLGGIYEQVFEATP